MHPEDALQALCRERSVAALYVFGSRAGDVMRWLRRQGKALAPGPADVDMGFRAVPGTRLTVREKVRLALLLEDLLGDSRVDLVSLPEADPFLAANIVRGERLYARDDFEADEYDLYILRRAGDLAPLERERISLILGESA
jgi:uncharacterized protein